MTNLLVPAGFLASRGRPWALVLPLLCWLPQELLVFVALAGMILPFAVAGPRPADDYPARPDP